MRRYFMRVTRGGRQQPPRRVQRAMPGKVTTQCEPRSVLGRARELSDAPLFYHKHENIVRGQNIHRPTFRHTDELCDADIAYYRQHMTPRHANISRLMPGKTRHHHGATSMIRPRHAG